jgi:hypothetical protein
MGESERIDVLASERAEVRRERVASNVVGCAGGIEGSSSHTGKDSRGGSEGIRLSSGVGCLGDGGGGTIAQGGRDV